MPVQGQIDIRPTTPVEQTDALRAWIMDNDPFLKRHERNPIMRDYVPHIKYTTSIRLRLDRDPPRKFLRRKKITLKNKRVSEDIPAVILKGVPVYGFNPKEYQDKGRELLTDLLVQVLAEEGEVLIPGVGTVFTKLVTYTKGEPYMYYGFRMNRNFTTVLNQNRYQYKSSAGQARPG